MVNENTKPDKDTSGIEHPDQVVKTNGEAEQHPLGAKFTATEQRILAVLSDGDRHHRDELRDAIDPYTNWDNLRAHLDNIRAKLKPRGQTILCEYFRMGMHYRHVRFLHDSSRE